MLFITGQTATQEIFCKNLQYKLSGSLALRKENLFAPNESQLRDQSKDHQ